MLSMKGRRKNKMTEYENNRLLLEALIEKMPEDDPDKKEAELHGFIEPIIELFTECYDSQQLVEWLNEHNMEPLADFRYADIRERSEYDTEEDWEEAKEDALLISDDGEAICLSW